MAHGLQTSLSLIPWISPRQMRVWSRVCLSTFLWILPCDAPLVLAQDIHAERSMFVGGLAAQDQTAIRDAWEPTLASPVSVGTVHVVAGGGESAGWNALHRYLDWHVLEVLLAIFSLFVVTLVMLYLHTLHVNHALHAAQQRLQVMAYHDALTGLPNRVLLEERLSLALARAKRSGHEVAVCLLDLDGFKPINDTFGHLIGDRVLQEVAERIKGCLRESDMVARYGGDEFVLVLDDLVEQRQSREVVERVLMAVAQPLLCHPGARVRASIGVSIYPEDATDAFSLLKHADEAMYAAKRDGGNHFVMSAPRLTVVPPRPILFRKA